VSGAPGPEAYVFGHSEVELERLAFQAELVGPFTRQLLVDAGVTSGMRVLDVGTGRGDVAFLAADLVGESGQVVGVDRAPEAVAVAQERAERAGLANVSFVQGDPADMSFEMPLDAVVGRYVLQFQPEPAEMLGRLASRLRPGGIFAFHEIDWAGHRSSPPVALWDRCCDLVVDAVATGGAEIHSGSKLPSWFVQAGLPAPSMRMAAIVGAGANCQDAAKRLAGLVATLLPALEQRRLVEPGELDPRTLVARLVREVTATASFVVAASELTGWTSV
jgi:SAM-dependent methyltransferase